MRFSSLLAASILVAGSLASRAEAQTWQMQPLAIPTRWAKDVSPTNALPEYPRPQMVRQQWENLNGLWQYAITSRDDSLPKQYEGSILVPYPIESALSGVKKRLDPMQALWYTRTLRKPALKTGERALLQFGAVDWHATVYVNGTETCQHKGGYTSFACDITDALHPANDTRDNTIVVKVLDPTDQGINPHGKQTLRPEAIFYTPTSGIWQTVWLEIVPAVSISNLRFTPDVDGKKLDIQVNIAAGVKDAVTKDYTVEITATQKNGAAKTVVGTVTGAPNAPLKLNVSNPHLWSPDDPFLYDLTVRLLQQGKAVDQVASYFGMRKVEIKKDAGGLARIFLNNNYVYNHGTLDQGFWPDGLYTAPTDAALQFDVQIIKSMGFNTIRKHIKVEPARWYYHCDRLGILVWQDMVQPGNDSQEGRDEFEKESKDILDQLHNAPSISTWVLFNERWGSYDQKRLTEWIKATDPSRLVNGHSGELLYVNQQLRAPSDSPWVSSDIADVHSYPDPMPVPLFSDKAAIVGEFGGIGVSIQGHLWDTLTAGWGYGEGAIQLTGLQKQYTGMIDSLKTLSTMGVGGSVYTQPFDVESEQNGLLTYDRAIIKMAIPVIRKINARLWPITRNTDAVTQGVTATLADTIDRKYLALVDQFKQGKRDSIFLRDLGTRAGNKQDRAMAASVAAVFIPQLKDPFAYQNLRAITQMALTSRDPAFLFLQQHMDTIVGLTGSRVKTKLQDVLFKDQVLPLLTPTPAWPQIDARINTILKKSPGLDGELIFKSVVLQYVKAPAKDCRNLIAASKRYVDRFKKGDYAAWARAASAQCTGTPALNAALAWSEKAVEENSSDPALLHLQAGILYKLGRSADAIEREEKAIQLDPSNTEYQAVLEKMKKGGK